MFVPSLLTAGCGHRCAVTVVHRLELSPLVKYARTYGVFLTPHSFLPRFLMSGLALSAVTALLGTSLFSPFVHAQSLTDQQLEDVKDNLWLGAQQTYVVALLHARHTHSFYHTSWEIGTKAQAFLESNAEAYSVFSDTPLPPPAGNASAIYDYDALQPVLQIAYNAASARANSTGAQPIMWVPGGAPGDSVSIGVAILVANWTGAPEPELNKPIATDSPLGTSSGQGVTYAQAAEEQLEYLLTVVPRAPNGAISHRLETTQLWCVRVWVVWRRDADDVR